MPVESRAEPPLGNFAGKEFDSAMRACPMPTFPAHDRGANLKSDLSQARLVKANLKAATLT